MSNQQVCDALDKAIEANEKPKRPTFRAFWEEVIKDPEVKKEYDAIVREEQDRMPSGEITALKFSDSRFEEKGVTSRDEGMRIREQVKQLGEWEEEKI